MKILVIGGAGFIGSHLAENLLSNGHKIVVIDNYETGSYSNLRGISDGITIYDMDISNYLSVKSVFKHFKPNIVIHTAASYKDPNDWIRDTQTNCTGTAVVCELSKEIGVERLIYFQTSLCYGIDPYKNFEDIRGCPLLIDHPVNPAPNSYAITKTCAEQIIAMSGIPFISLRLANIYGPRNLTGAIPAFYKKLSNGEVATVAQTRRDFVYVSDLVNLVIRIIQGEGSRNYYHVSTGRDYPIIDIFHTMTELMGIHEKYPFPDQRLCRVIEKKAEDAETILLDSSETHRDFPGWIADTPIREGLKSAIEWYKEHPVTQTYTHLKEMK